MNEKFEEKTSNDKIWKERGSNETPYRARKISHESNTSIEYGEKTWTTAQTVRDLMQNHLDAETGRFFEKISSSLFDEETLKNYLEGKEGSENRKKQKIYFTLLFYTQNKGETNRKTRKFFLKIISKH